MGGSGADHLAGDLGIDTAAYDYSPAGVFVALITGVAKGGDATGYTFDSIENLSGSGYADTLLGGQRPQRTRNAGDDTINGGWAAIPFPTMTPAWVWALTSPSAGGSTAAAETTRSSASRTLTAPPTMTVCMATGKQTLSKAWKATTIFGATAVETPSMVETT